MRQSAKQNYWLFANHVALWKKALLGTGHQFRNLVLTEHLTAIGKVEPITGEVSERINAAAGWLARAHDASLDDGVSYGYFPCRPEGWEVSYPETTGYIITSLIKHGLVTGDFSFCERASRMAVWEVEVQMPSGAVQGGKLVDSSNRSPATFNTGMVLDGFVSILQQQSLSTPAIEDAACKAADFLKKDISPEGYFKTNGAFVTSETIKLYNVLCAWALYRYGLLNEDVGAKSAAILAVEGAVKKQRMNGWFEDNCLTDPTRPLTHTIGYTLQGILEVGAMSSRQDFVQAAKRGLDPLIKSVGANGFLPGRFYQDWRPAASWSCLTGSAQIAIVAYRLSELGFGSEYSQFANRLVDFLKALQRTNTGEPGIDGALAGSYPILSGYMVGSYPNWATKYLLDALYLQAKHQGISPELV